jgi:FHA domain
MLYCTHTQVCQVCKGPYKTHLRLPGGGFLPLLRPELQPPYVSFTVCTRHENAEALFSTRFHLKLGSVARPLVIGRSHACDMVLDYRTVSTQHAAVSFKKGQFLFTDLSSSNGSYQYVRQPLPLR